jgi:hypothetical protein
VSAPQDAPPLTTSQQAVLDLLKAGPRTHAQLAALTPVWFSAISTLRGRGYQILSDMGDDGGLTFTLYDVEGL